MSSIGGRGVPLLGPLWEPLVLVLGHVFAGMFLLNLAAEPLEIDDPAARAVANGLHQLFRSLLQGSLPVRLAMALLVLALLVQGLRGRSIRWACDLMGALLAVRCVLQFLLMNLLLLAPLRAGGLLLIQLVLFLPVITANFGWLYWRLDSGSRRLGWSQIRFDEEPPEIFDYFHVASIQLLQFEPGVAKALTRGMKGLFVLHGLMMMDLVALTLSRAIGLASGS